MKFKTKVTEVEAVRWDGKHHGFWNGVGGEGLNQPDGGMTWLGEAVSKQTHDDGAIWADGDLLYVRHADDSEGEPYREEVEPGMWLVWEHESIWVYSQEVFDRLYEPA